MAVKSVDQITIIDVTDAYSVILTSEAYTFVGGTIGVEAGNTCSTQAVAYCGASQCQVVNVDSTKVVCPTGISASVTGNGTSTVTITFTTTATVSSACEAIIPVSVDDITVNKKFSFAVAKTGSKGQDGTSVTISSTEIRYVASSSGTTTPSSTANWQPSVPTVNNGQYLWTRTIVTYSDGKKTEAYSVSYKGTNGNSVSVSSTEIRYVASSSGTSEPSSTANWQPSVPSVEDGQYLWTRTIVTYSDGKSTTSYSVSYKAADGVDGDDGKDGANAFLMTITSSNGIVFKNSSGSTTLTAHIFIGGVEQNITDAGICGDLGTVRWYKGTTLVKTGKTHTVDAKDVKTSQVYSVQLEKDEEDE